MAENLTEDRLRDIVAGLADPTNPCDACRAGMPGVLAPHIPAEAPPDRLWVERCDACRRYPDDVDAAAALADAADLNAHRYYDTWWTFMAAPGSPEDHDVAEDHAADDTFILVPLTRPMAGLIAAAIRQELKHENRKRSATVRKFGASAELTRNDERVALLTSAYRLIHPGATRHVDPEEETRERRPA